MEEFQKTIIQLLKVNLDQQQKFEERQEMELHKTIIIPTIYPAENWAAAKTLWRNTRKFMKWLKKLWKCHDVTIIYNSIDTFEYVPENDKTFEAFYKRYEDIFNVGWEQWPILKKKVRLLLRKLGTTLGNMKSTFVDFILPKKTTDLDFSKTIYLLSKLFGPITTLFHKRWKCLNPDQDNQQDFLTFAASVNKHCNDFKLAELTADDLKCLIFAQGLVSAEDAEVRRQVLTKLENEQGLTLQKLAEDCQRVIFVKCDSKTIEESGAAQIRKIRS